MPPPSFHQVRSTTSTCAQVDYFDSYRFRIIVISGRMSRHAAVALELSMMPLIAAFGRSGVTAVSDERFARCRGVAIATPASFASQCRPRRCRPPLGESVNRGSRPAYVRFSRRDALANSRCRFAFAVAAPEVRVCQDRRASLLAFQGLGRHSLVTVRCRSPRNRAAIERHARSGQHRLGICWRYIWRHIPLRGFLAIATVVAPSLGCSRRESYAVSRAPKRPPRLIEAAIVYRRGRTLYLAPLASTAAFAGFTLPRLLRGRSTFRRSFLALRRHGTIAEHRPVTAVGCAKDC